MTSSRRTCRFCATPLEHTFADLGTTPLANSYLESGDLDRPELFLPLHAYVCSSCFLVQLVDFAKPKAIFSEYAYFSSYSESWLRHARTFSEEAIRRFGLGSSHRVVEIGSNDGYLLRNFVAAGIPCLGIEPAANVAEVAQAAGIPTMVRFFGSELARELVAAGGAADLVVGNNVLAHVPQLNDFVAGLARLLAPEGVVSMEFPHLLNLIEKRQFDTIYHEHFSYLSLFTVEKVFAAHGLRIFDVESLSTHGGSIRIWGARTGSSRATTPAVAELVAAEDRAGLRTLAPYLAFGPGIRAAKLALLSFLVDAARQGMQVAGYGAPAKGNTLLNYCGIRADLLAYTVDLNPVKQGTFLPGTRIPVHAPERIRETRPDVLLILPWNLRAEISAQMSFVREWGGRFAVPIPTLEVW